MAEAWLERKKQRPKHLMNNAPRAPMGTHGPAGFTNSLKSCTLLPFCHRLRAQSQYLRVSYLRKLALLQPAPQLPVPRLPPQTHAAAFATAWPQFAPPAYVSRKTGYGAVSSPAQGPFPRPPKKVWSSRSPQRRSLRHSFQCRSFHHTYATFSPQSAFNHLATQSATV